MSQINVEYNVGGIKGLCVIEPTVHPDERGFFMETFNADDMKAAYLDFTFVQDNQSHSKKGVLRGLHYQKQYQQTKLIRVIHGSIYNVAVDLRKGSPTFGKHYGLILSEENRLQFLVPRGFANGHLVLSEWADVIYKCDDFFHPGDSAGVAWNDPKIGIKWPDVVGEYPGSADPSGYTLSDGTPLLLSEKDKSWNRLEHRW